MLNKLISILKKLLIFIKLNNSGIKGFFVKLFNFQKYFIVWRSIRFSDSVNYRLKPEPWFTYPTIEYLNNIKLLDLNVFEYGSGNGTKYFLERGAKVTSVEDDKDWYDKISLNKHKNHNYLFSKNQKEYVERRELIDSEIIIIDGSFRNRCTKYIISLFKTEKIDPAMIIFDNSDWYPNSLEILDKTFKWQRVDFCGFGAVVPFTWVTSIYLNPNKVLKRVSKNLSSIGGVKHYLD